MFKELIVAIEVYEHNYSRGPNGSTIHTVHLDDATIVTETLDRNGALESETLMDVAGATRVVFYDKSGNLLPSRNQTS